MRPIITEIPPLPDTCEFMFEIGEYYETQSGNYIHVMNRTNFAGYETLQCADFKHRYDRSTHNVDAGRVTGSKHDYSDPANFVKPPRKCHHPVSVRKNKWAVCQDCGKSLE